MPKLSTAKAFRKPLLRPNLDHIHTQPDFFSDSVPKKCDSLRHITQVCSPKIFPLQDGIAGHIADIHFDTRKCAELT